MSVYLHIPKTAGTALRNAFLLPENQGKVLPFTVAPTHNVTVSNCERQHEGCEAKAERTA